MFGCEGFGSGRSCFQAAPRLAGVAAGGIHSGNVRGEDDAAARLRAADPGRPDIAVIRDNETMMFVMAVLVERRRSEAQRPSLPLRGSEAAQVVFRSLSPGGAIR